MRVDDSVTHMIIALANFAVSGSIGTAANTVDKVSVVEINQTTPNVILTMPNSGTKGDTFSVVNVGTVQLKVQETYIDPGRASTWIFSTTWRPFSNESDYINVAASRAITENDSYKTLLAATAITLTVPLNLFQHTQFRVRQSAPAGVITIAVAAGLTLIAPFGAGTAGLDGADMIVEICGTDVYVS